MDKAKRCFETYTMHPEVTEKILSNLDIIKDLYPYTDIAQNPPSGVAQPVNYAEKLAELKTTIASSDTLVSTVYRAIMKFISSFHDPHFNLITENQGLYWSYEYYNVFSAVYGWLPFKWDGDMDDHDNMIAYVHSPHPSFMSDETYDAIFNLYVDGLYVKEIDGKNAYEFLSNFFGEYDNMKTSQGSLTHTRFLQQNGFRVLQYPIDGLFDNHTLLYSNGTTVTFQYGFMNMEAPCRREDRLPKPDTDFKVNSMEDVKKTIEIMKNFKPRSIKRDHTKVICTVDTGLNYMRINSFDYKNEAAMEYIQELTECVAEFNENQNPVAVILPHNVGGSFQTMIPTQVILMPTSDYRIVGSMRKTDSTKHVAVDSDFLTAHKFGGESETCEVFTTKSDIETFWEKTVTDDLGNSITHERTDLAFATFKDSVNNILSLALTHRKPTDILIVTDGFCFDTCAFFVNNAIKSGSAIVAGYGPTRSLDVELFPAGQCPSISGNPADYFTEIANNTEYGLTFTIPLVESFDATNPRNHIPGDYSFQPVDLHMGFFQEFDTSNTPLVKAFIWYLNQTVLGYQTQCNPANKRLLLVSDECNSGDKPHAVSFGYACGENGEWDKTSCKVASCEQGYLVDFKNDACVPYTCVPSAPSSSSSSVQPSSSTSSSKTPVQSSSSSMTPVQSSSSSRTPAQSSSGSRTPAQSSPVPSSSATLYPMMAVIGAIFFALF